MNGYSNESMDESLIIENMIHRKTSDSATIAVHAPNLKYLDDILHM